VPNLLWELRSTEKVLNTHTNICKHINQNDLYSAKFIRNINLNRRDTLCSRHILLKICM
jgi:hypothetical protein